VLTFLRLVPHIAARTDTIRFRDNSRKLALTGALLVSCVPRQSRSMPNPVALAWSAAVSLAVLVVGLAVLEVLRLRGFDPVGALSRPFLPTPPAASSTTPPVTP